MFIYFFSRFEKGKNVKNTSEELFYKSLADYCKDKALDLDLSKLAIKKNSNGKPFFDNIDLHYNISHSENFWICAISENPVGIDLQVKNSDKFGKISKRYFTREEDDYIESGGSDAFFKIWTIKEAYAKFLGESIFKIIGKIETVKKGFILDEIDGVKLTFLDLSKWTLSKDIKCTVASKEDEEICIKTII